MNFRVSKDQQGSMNILVVPLILAIVLFLVALVFGVWAFSSREDYKNNTDQKVEAAVAVAVQQAKTAKDNEFIQKEKEPFKSYTSPSNFGSFSFQYPKTWSGYTNETGNQFTLTMQPDVVSSSASTAYSLKVEVLPTPYAQAITQHENDIKQGKLTASAVTLPKVPEVVGLRVDGQITPSKKGTTVYLPLREKTIKISAEAPDKVPDLNNTILPSFVFKP